MKKKLSQIGEFGLIEHIKTKHTALRDAVRNEKAISAENEVKLTDIIKNFVSTNY